METLESLKKRIESTEDLRSVVKTMKALAAVNIRQYERAVASLADYSRAIEMGLQVLVRSRPGVSLGTKRAPKNQLGAIVFGSDQGMCGQLNEQIASHAMNTMKHIGIQRESRSLLAIGERVAARLEDADQPVEEYRTVPGSTSGITPMVQEVLLTIEAWDREKGIDQVYLFYSEHLSSASFRPYTVHLLPVDQQWLARLEEEPWPSHSLPAFTMDWEPLLSALIRQYLFVSLFRAFAESLVSENASRLASMQGAERNIEDQLAGLNSRYHRQRQMAITEELLDIVAGFEALKE
jgi:F-type H+-transporting ATPase subunit gamma